MRRSALHRFVLLLVLTLAASPLLGAGERWTPIGPPGGRVTALVVDPSSPRVAYAGVEAGGVFKSVDGGRSWIAVNRGLTSLQVVDLALDAGSPSILYADRCQLFVQPAGQPARLASSGGVPCSARYSLKA